MKIVRFTKNIWEKEENCEKMMRAFLIGILLALIGIGVDEIYQYVSANQFSKREEQKDLSDKKSLIIYFSLSGNTKDAAYQIKRYTNADIVRLEPKKPYLQGYDNYVPVARKQLKEKAFPAIKDNLPNLEKYKVIYLGFPTWWHQPPRIIHTFFRDYDVKGKVIVPFTTSMSDPISKSMPYIDRMAKKANTDEVIYGYRYDGNNQDLKDFLQRNNLIK